jgi:hypothetical protein
MKFKLILVCAIFPYLTSCLNLQENVAGFVRNKDGACDKLTVNLTLDGRKQGEFSLLPGQEGGPSYATVNGARGPQTIEINAVCIADGISTELTKTYDFATPYLIWEIRVKNRGAPVLVFGPV